MPSGILRTFQEDLHGLWKIPRLFWAEAPSPPFPRVKALVTHLSLGTHRVGMACWLPYLYLGPGFPVLAGYSSV